MADLALALATPAATTPGAPALAATPAKTTAATKTTDPFAILMAAATPAASVGVVAKLPSAALPVAVKTGNTTLPEVAEKARDDGAKDDRDADASSPDALLALLTTPAPIAVTSPVVATPPVVPVVAAPVADTSNPTLVTTAATLVSTAPAVLAKPAVPSAVAAAALANPVASNDSTPAASATPVTQTSIHALVQMMTAQADSAPVQQQVAAQTAADSTPNQTLGEAPVPVTNPTEAEQMTPVVAAKTVAPTLRMIAPKLDGVSTVVTKTEAKAGTAIAKTEARATKTASAREPAPSAPSARAETAPQPQAQQPVADAPARDTVVTAKSASLGSVDSVVTRHLAVARDGQWLDSLAKDIAATGGSNSNLSFTLSPEHLGSLKVDILSGSDGASVHMTTDNDTARNIILDAQPRLAAEARAQGLTLKETSVSTNGDSPRQAQSQAQQQSASQSSSQQGGQDRRTFAQAAQQPLSATVSNAADEESDGDLYA